MAEYILRDQAIIAVTGAKLPDVSASGRPIANGKRSVTDCVRRLKDIPAADVRPVPEGGIGEMSDGYHTFNGLYYQRMILFAALVKAYRDKAWKSHRHEDGELCFGGGWFIVGIDTPEGSYTYHYDDTVWDFFDCEELPTAKHWDGHTEKDVTRLLSLDAKPRWIPVTERLPKEGEFVLVHGNFYPNKHDGGVIAVSKRMDWNYWQGFGREIDITHWMSLPPAPKEE